MRKVESVAGYGIYLDKEKYYILRWREGGRAKSRSLDAKNLTEARRAAQVLIRQIADPAMAIQPGSGNDPAFGEIWLEFEQRKRRRMLAGDLTPERFRLLMYRLDKYYRPNFFRVRTSKLERAILALDVELRSGEKPLSPNTIDDVIRSARECWKLAFQMGRTAYGPTDGYKTAGFQQPSARRPKGRYLGFDEVGKLLSIATRGHVRDLLLIELGTGVRTGQIADLKAHQVHLDLDVINFDEWSRPESNKGRPISPITGPLWEVLERLVADALPSGHLIHYRGEPVADGARNFYQTINRLRVRAGIGQTDAEPVNHYSIRRTFADLLAERVPGPALSQAMGHGRVDRRDQRRIFDERRPTTDIYVRRQLSPTHMMGQAIEKYWWPQIQPHATVFLGSSRGDFHTKALEKVEET